MADKRKLNIQYSKQSFQNAQEIIAYLKWKFSEREVNNFYQALHDFENIVCFYPTLFAKSKKKNIRRAVLSKVLSVYYAINNNTISIIAILDTRWSESKKMK